jgi:predicted transposase YbfD/YdcC
MTRPALPIEAIQVLEMIEDPRRKQAQRHSLISIMAIVFCGLAMGEEGWERMANMASMCWSWFQKVLPCAKVAPSADTLRRTISSIKPEAFQEYFKAWCKALHLDQKDLLHADGKKIRGSDEGYVVSLYSKQEHLCIAHQSVVDGGEQGALKQLIQDLELEGATVTLDAGFCSRSLAKEFQASKTNYIMAVKRNQKELFEEIGELIERQVKEGHLQPPEIRLDEAHGRSETRIAYVLNDPSLIDLNDPFPGIKTVGWVDSEVYRTKEQLDQVQPTSSRRVYISSKILSPAELQNAVRDHWSIENNLHWLLDVAFGEDSCPVRNRTAAENLSWMRKLLLHSLKKLFPKFSVPKAAQIMRYSDSARLQLLSLLGGTS